MNFYQIVKNNFLQFRLIFLSISGVLTLLIYLSYNSYVNNNTLIKTHTNLSNLKTKKIKLGIRSEFIKIAQNQNENLVDVNVEKVEDLGNYKLITAKLGDFTIKSKVTRETEIPSSKVKLHIPADRCCVYEDNKLI